MTATRRTFLKIAGISLLASRRLSVAAPAVSPAVPVLMYHDIAQEHDEEYTVSPGAFAAQMEWLATAGYRTLSLRQLPEALRSSPGKRVILTFDDGYASFMDYAAPFLQEYGFTATINLILDRMGGFIELGGNRPVLSWDECRMLRKSGLAEFGCHGFGLHVRGGMVAVDSGRVRNDLVLCREVFQREMAEPCPILAWPYGLHDARTVAIAREVGFLYLLTSKKGFLERGSTLTAIPRLAITREQDLRSFQRSLSARR